VVEFDSLWFTMHQHNNNNNDDNNNQDAAYDTLIRPKPLEELL